MKKGSEVAAGRQVAKLLGSMYIKNSRQCSQDPEHSRSDPDPMDADPGPESQINLNFEFILLK